MTRRFERNRGFSLVELLVVMTVLSIAAAAAAPNISRMLENYRLKAAARQLASDLQLAKMRAISEKVQYKAVFDGTNKSYVIYRGNFSSGSTSWVQFGVARELAVESSPYAARDVSLSENFTNHEAYFSPSGGVSPAGTAILSSTNSSRRVVVNLAGRIRLE